ncbi:hypothetical protein J5N97_012695 [Dioscorea zingiberensis]|uniref:AP2/ERF domain-containing protein n=1 Tax=Dioscorea zingiberensis TaxID=325984 RepID=A0A9D5HHY8_9LILI|nr:hypothetical protein J5N97_012695 [Dioscorea zingiberensis]
MAAAAYDVAVYRLRGREAQLNFPDLVNEFPRPRSEEAEEIRLAAVEAAVRVGRTPEMVRRGSGSLPALKSLSRGLGCEELGLDSPKMWAELAEALLLAPPPPPPVMEISEGEVSVTEHLTDSGITWNPLVRRGCNRLENPTKRPQISPEVSSACPGLILVLYWLRWRIQ